MQFLAVAALLFVARVAAEQPQEVSNAQPVQAPVVGQPQSGPVSQAVPVSVEQQQGPPQPVVHHYSPSGPSPYPVEHQTHGGQYVPQQAGVVSQYSPSGMVQVVSAVDNKQYVGVGGAQGVRHYAAGPVQMGGSNSAGVEQYGQPEPAGMPPNYKPFGSWGLYIGGNPADGYYSNYYKALSNSVDKQQVSGVEPSVKPGVSSGAGVGQASAFGPMMKQASYPYSSYQDQVYPFDYYTTADLNSGSRVVSVESQPAAAAMPSTYSASGRMSPVQMGAQMYGSPVGSEQPSVYADSSFGASKRSTGKQDSQVQQQVQTSGAKGFAQKRYGYAYSPAAPQYGSQQQPQVFAYPVPVGSQIVGSQPGVEGAFQPYGVHGYTRYAIKPTVVASEQQSYYGVQSSPQYPVYKQYQQHQQHQQYPVVYQQQQQQAHQQPQQAPVQQHAPVAAAGQAAYQPLGFYGYPLSQLHYSQGSIVPAFQSSVVEHQPAGVVAASPVGPGVQVEAASSEKSESEVEKPTQTGQKNQHHQHQQQQKRA